MWEKKCCLRQGKKKNHTRNKSSVTYTKKNLIIYLKETRNLSKIQPLNFYKKMIAQLRKMFCKIPMNTRATISAMLLC